MNERINVDPRIQHGRPVIKGTRVPVYVILGALAGGDTPASVMDQYGLEDADVRAAIEFAAEIIESERYYPLAASAEPTDT